MLTPPHFSIIAPPVHQTQPPITSSEPWMFGLRAPTAAAADPAPEEQRKATEVRCVCPSSLMVSKCGEPPSSNPPTSNPRTSLVLPDKQDRPAGGNKRPGVIDAEDGKTPKRQAIA